MRPVVQALVAALLFGAATPVSKLLLAGLPPQALAGLLYLGAALATAPALLGVRAHGAAHRSARDRARLAGAIALGGVVAPVLLLAGLQRASAGAVALWLNLEVALTAALGALWFREPLGVRGWLGAAGIVAAGAAVAGGEGAAGPGAGLLVAGACACWAVDNHLTARVEGVTPARATFWKGAIAGTTNLVLAMLVDPPRFEAGAIAGALAVGGLAYGASIALYVSAAQQLGATRAQGVFAVAPFLGAGLAWLVLGEPIGVARATGAVVLAASVALLLRARHEHEHAHGEVEHVHAHRHDDGHHLHGHPGLPSATRHVHWHRHEPLVHAHPHWPDLHHRHDHRRRAHG